MIVTNFMGEGLKRAFLSARKSRGELLHTDCWGCGASMPDVPAAKSDSPLDRVSFTLTGFRCLRCGHFNDLKRREKHGVK
jgi:hypothetical protein